jgi:hypothetical protein
MEARIKYNDNPAKRFLRGYKALILRRDSLLREIERLRESITGTTVALKEDVVSGGGASDRMGATVAQIVDAEEALKPVLAEITQSVGEIMSAIDSVQDEMQKTVLTLRYIEGLDWLTVSGKIGYEIAQTYVIHGRALVAVNRWLEKQRDDKTS